MRWTTLPALALALVAMAPHVAARDTNAQITLAGPAFVAVQVADVEGAARWYVRIFDLREVNRIDAEDGRYRIRILSGHDLSIELIEARGVQRPPERHLGLFKAGLYVTDIDAFHARLHSLGVDVDGRIFTDGALDVRSFVFRDPEGNRLQAFAPCAGAC